MALLDQVKKRCGIAESVSVYDDELQSLIDYAVFDMEESGVPSSMIEEEGAAVINTIVFFVKREMAETTDLKSRYDHLYDQAVFRLSLYSVDTSEEDDDT